MLTSPTLRPLRNNRGMTLVELMIVVAIIGILASIAGVAFYRQVKSAKITQLEQYAMDIARGQEEFYSRHNSYFPLTTTVFSFTGADPDNAAGNRMTAKQVLSFNAPTLPSEATVMVAAGKAGEACPATVCGGASITTTSAWYAVRVFQDLDGQDGTDPNKNSAVIVTSTMQRPLRINEGQ